MTNSKPAGTFAIHITFVSDRGINYLWTAPVNYNIVDETARAERFYESGELSVQRVDQIGGRL